MEGAWGDAAEQLVLQPVAEALRRVRGQAKVVVHVKAVDRGEIEIWGVSERLEGRGLAGGGGEHQPGMAPFVDGLAQGLGGCRRGGGPHLLGGGGRVDRQRAVGCRHSEVSFVVVV